MDLRQLKTIIKEFEESNVHKLEITEKDFTVKLEKKSDNINQVAQQYIPIQEAKQPQENVIDKQNYAEVKAPLVGTFYNSPSPDSKPFIEVNSLVRKGDVLFIIEAMKVMNEITSPIDGIVKKINVQNSTMVEFGQVIMEIEE